MALSSVTYAGDGSTTNFTFNIPYIESTDVKVYEDGVLQVLATDYTWFNSTTVQFNTAPANAAVVKLDRQTENGTRLVDFQDAGNLTEADLDLSANQAFYLAQESQDAFDENALALASDDKWDAESKVIKNVADGVADNDAVNKAQASALTAADVVLTNADVVSTNADVVSTAADAVDTDADATATAIDALATAADVVSCAASLDSFDDVYLGAHAAEPTLDNDGDALAAGALFFHTTGNIMKVYSGSAWAALDDMGGLAVTKGNLVVGNGTDHTVLAVGADGEVPIADSGEATGIRWATQGMEFHTTFDTVSNSVLGETTTIPSWVTKIVVMLEDVSSSGTGTHYVSLGTSSGYAVHSDVRSEYNGTLYSSSTGIVLNNSGANTDRNRGFITMYRGPGNEWFVSANLFQYATTTKMLNIGGHLAVNTGFGLDRIKLHTSSGTMDGTSEAHIYIG